MSRKLEQVDGESKSSSRFLEWHLENWNEKIATCKQMLIDKNKYENGNYINKEALTTDVTMSASTNMMTRRAINIPLQFRWFWFADTNCKIQNVFN